MRNAFNSLLAEPRAPGAPRRVWRDWVLVAALVPTAVLEGIFRELPVWRPISIVLVVGLVFTLRWRRTNPLVVVAVAFGSVAVVDFAAIIAGVEWETLNTTAFVLLLPYSLFRWGSGREAAIGLAIMLVAAVLGAVNDPNTVNDVLGGILILLLFMAVGASVRYQDNAQRRQVEQGKLVEREQLARELHDTVAHHVSAIAVQAQAGRTLARSKPEAAIDALETIEEEASRALTEMRSMVGALRQGEDPDLAPQRGVADIERLANGAGDLPHVEVELSGDLDELRPSVQAALYRLAQESITNAVRHARHATRINVCVAGDDNRVRLTVSDDGVATPLSAGSSSGFGIVGMTERAALLGGTLDAGPSTNGGWTVNAVLPRNRQAR